MGFGDKLKGLREQAQQAVAENKDRIQGAVQVVGDAANTKTHGKYAGKIAHVGEKVTGSVEKFADGGPAAEGSATQPAAEGQAAPEAQAAAEAQAAPEAQAAAEAQAAPEAPAAPHTDPASGMQAGQQTEGTRAAADGTAAGFPEFE